MCEAGDIARRIPHPFGVSLPFPNRFAFILWRLARAGWEHSLLVAFEGASKLKIGA